MKTPMRFKFPLVVVLLLLHAVSAQADLLTNFTDDFNRADGAIGTNYTEGSGSPYIVTNNTLLRTGTNTAQTYLNLGTLPTTADFGNGYTYSTSLDLYFDTQATSRLLGLMVNYDPDNGSFGSVNIRGDGTGTLQWRDGVDTRSIFTGVSWSDNTWYTVKVSSAETGVYNITLSLQGSTNALRIGTFTDSSPVEGGYVGFFAQLPDATNNYYDNLNFTGFAPVTYGGGSGVWSTGFDTAPATNNNLVFAGVGGTATNDIASGSLGSVNSILFKAGAGAYTLTAASGSAGFNTNTPLGISAGIANKSSSTQTVNLALSLNGPQTVNADSNNIILGGVVSGSGKLTKIGASTLVLTASNTYSGGTIIDAGALQIGNGGASGMVVTSGITNNATLIYNRSDEQSLGAVAGTGTVIVNSGTLNTRNAGSLATTNLIINAGTVLGNHATSFGVGNITLGNTNGGSSAATLRFNDNASPTYSNNILLGTSSGTLKIQAGTEGVAGTLTFAGNITGSNSFTIQNDGTAGGDGTNRVAFSGSINNIGRVIYTGLNNRDRTTISGSLGANVTGLTVSSGTLTLSGANTAFTGDTLVNSGTLILSNGNNRLGASGRLNVTNGGVLNLGGNSQTLSELSGNGTVTNWGVLTLDVAASTSFGGDLLGAGSVTKSGAGTVTYAGTMGYSGGTLVSAGTLQLGNGGSAGALVGAITNNAVLSFNRNNTYSFTNVLSGTGAIVQNGTGTLSRRNQGVGSNSVVVNSGTYSVNQGAALGVGTFTLGNTNGGSASATLLHNDNGSFYATNNILLGSSSGAMTIAGFLDERGDQGDFELTGGITGNGSLTIAMTNTAGTNVWTAGFYGDINNAGRIIYTNNFAGTNVVVSRIAGQIGSNVTGVTVHSGLLKLTADNADYTGGALINGGTLQIGDGEASGGIAGAITNNGALAFNRTGTSTNTSTISGTGSFTKSGAGTLVLNGAANNTYAGATVVGGGALVLSNSGGHAIHNSSGITVNNGASLIIGANDQVADTVNVTLSGGTIVRGDGASEVFGNLNLTTASFLNFGTGVAGTLQFGTYTPVSLLTINSFGAGNVLKFGSDLSSYVPTGGALTNSFFAFSGGFTSEWNGVDTFTITAIPEPATVLAAAGLTAIFLLSSASRRRMRPGRVFPGNEEA